MGFKRAFIHGFIILAILSATISPACAFISGKNATWIEICSGMSTKLIQEDGRRDDAPDITSDSCPFCFQAAHFSALGVDNSVLITAVHYSLLHDGFVAEDALIRFVSSAQPRAPPFFS